MLPLWTTDVYKAAMHANFIYLPIHTLLKIWDRTDRLDILIQKLSRVDTVYLEAILVSFTFRGILYILSVWKLDNRWDILAVFGLMQLGYFVFDMRKKIKQVEKFIY